MDAFAGHLAINLASAGICQDKLASAGIDPNTLMIDMWELVNSGEVGQAEAMLAAVIKVCTPASAVPAADAQNPAPPAPASAAPPAAASAAPAATTAPASAAPVPELVAPAATPASAAHAVPELVAPPVAASSAPAATTALASAAHAVPEVVAPASAVPAPAVPTAGAALEPVPVTPPPTRMLASPRAGLPAMPTEPAAAASAVHREACHIDTPSCKAVVKGTRRWGTRRALANRRPAASAAAAATDSQPAANERMLMTDLRTAFMNAMRAASAETIEPVSEVFKHVNPNAHLAPTDSQMFWAIEQSDVQLGKADIAALAADIVSTWRACRRGMQRHHECDEIVGRMWPGRCVQDVALAIDDRAKYEAFMDTLVLVDTEFSILASAMATDPAVPERLMKRPAASAAPASPGSEENDFEGESAPPRSKKTPAAKASAAKASAAQASEASAAQASAAKAAPSDLLLARNRLRSDMISDPTFMPGAASRVRFGAAQKILKAARAGYSHAAVAASPDVALGLKDLHSMTASAVEHRSGCPKCRWNSRGCRKCRGE